MTFAPARKLWSDRFVDINTDGDRVVTASREISAPAAVIFELIADPAQQPRWDGNDNLAEAPGGQRVRGVGDVFTMNLTVGFVRENHIVEFEEGRLIAWRPSEVGKEPPGHLWRWELEPLDDGRTLVTHTYDWSQLTDEQRLPRARATTSDKLQASIDRLAALAES
ncbi:SRPBCC family protein [Mycolicibacterium mageritense]